MNHLSAAPDHIEVLEIDINGRPHCISSPDLRMSVADYLRSIGLIGTKVACAQGGCGACSVILTRRTPTGLDHRPVNACLRPLVSCDGCAITTVEGLGNTVDGLDPIQDQIVRHNGTQCGFCTPGFVTTARALLARNPSATRQQIEDAFGGNFCRCTGYRGILQAVRQFASDRAESDSPLIYEGEPNFPVRSEPVRPGQHLNEVADAAPAGKIFQTGQQRWCLPKTIDEAVEWRNDFTAEGATYVCGCTGFGMDRADWPNVAIDLSQISELRTTEATAERMRVGSAVSIQDFLDLVERSRTENPAFAKSVFSEITRYGQQIAGLQVRSVGTLAGSLMMLKRRAESERPFVSDLALMLSTLGANVQVCSNQFQGAGIQSRVEDLPRGSAMPGDALVVTIEIPQPASNNAFLVLERVARKRQMSHPLLAGGLYCELDDSGTIASARVVFSGVCGDVVRMKESEAALAGLRPDQILAALESFPKEFDRLAAMPVDFVNEGVNLSVRRRIALGLFYKLLVRFAEQAGADIDSRERSLTHSDRELSTSTYRCAIEAEVQPLTVPLPKVEGFGQASGEVRYTVDVPVGTGGLHAAIVWAPRAHARFEFEPCGEALDALLRDRFPGFECLLTAEDLPTDANIGAARDEPVFWNGSIPHYGARVGLVVATEWKVAHAAATFIRENCLKFDPLPAVVSLEETIKNGEPLPTSWPTPLVQVRPGTDLSLFDDSAALPDGVQVLDGTFATSHQAHFAMELRSAVATPGKNGEMHIVSATQWPNGDQGHVARVLGIPMSHVTVQVNQLGGGFGGAHHGSAQFSVLAALAARKTRKPVRVETTREENMLLIGKRHPILGTYRVLYQNDGTIVGMDVRFESNGGATTDVSWEVLSLAVDQADHAYSVPNFRVTAHAYKSNITSNTAFRSFGTVQSNLIVESAIERVAFALHQDGIEITPEDIRRKNFYRSSDSAEDSETNHKGQPLGRVRIRENFDTFLREIDFNRRAEAARTFNSSNRWKKRALAAIPFKYGLGLKHLPGLNTGAAVVSINVGDGSVTIISGGIEMGQGLTQRIVQLAAYELGIPVSRIRIGSANTDAVVNSAATAASSGFDIFGGAVAKACRELKSRLVPVWEHLGNSASKSHSPNWANDWGRLVTVAFSDRVALSVSATFHMPVKKALGSNDPMGPDNFTYFSYGYSASEVELDCATGAYSVLRGDVHFDVGRSSSPAADFGQLEGGFVQGMGMGTCEDLRFDADGKLVTDNIWSYEMPCSKSIPVQFHSALIQTPPEVLSQLEADGRIAVAGTRAVGEPSLIAGNSVFLALRRALIAGRAEFGQTEWPQISTPASVPSILSWIPIPESEFAPKTL